MADDELKSKISQLQVSLGALHRDVNTGFAELRSDIAKTNDRIDGTNNEVAGLSIEVKKTNTEVANLKGEVGNLKGEVGNLKGEVGNLKGEVGNLKEEVRNLRDRQDKVEVKLDAVITMTRDFRKDVSQKFDEIGRYFRSIDGMLGEHEMRISGVEKRVDKLEDAG